MISLLQALQCDICPHYCDLLLGQIGKCGVRQNINGVVSPTHYGKIAAISVERIEKKPFFHFCPGKKFLTVGLQSCNFRCSYCLPGHVLIRAIDGLKRMDEILEGDEIVAYDSISQQLVLARVGRVFDREVEEVLELEIDGRTIQITPEHPVLTKRGWVEAKDLAVDDEVLCDKIDL